MLTLTVAGPPLRDQQPNPLLPLVPGATTIPLRAFLTPAEQFGDRFGNSVPVGSVGECLDQGVDVAVLGDHHFPSGQQMPRCSMSRICRPRLPHSVGLSGSSWQRVCSRRGQGPQSLAIIQRAVSSS